MVKVGGDIYELINVSEKNCGVYNPENDWTNKVAHDWTTTPWYDKHYKQMVKEFMTFPITPEPDLGRQWFEEFMQLPPQPPTYREYDSCPKKWYITAPLDRIRPGAKVIVTPFSMGYTTGKVTTQGVVDPVLYDGLTSQECYSRFLEHQREDFTHPALTPAQKQVAVLLNSKTVTPRCPQSTLTMVGFVPNTSMPSTTRLDESSPASGQRSLSGRSVTLRSGHHQT